VLPVSPAVVIAVNPEVAVAPLAGEILDLAGGMLDLTGPLTVGVASPDPVPSGGASGMSLFNLAVEAVPEALVECVATGRRYGLTTRGGSCVLLLQRFAPATSSAEVYASPNPDHPVRISSRWGLPENGEVNATSDVFEVAADQVRHTLAGKPTASVTAPGGTRTVRLPAHRRHRYSLSRTAVSGLAALARDAARAVGRPLSLDVALVADAPVVVRCRPCG
jgi:hypothetical protein